MPPLVWIAKPWELPQPILHAVESVFAFGLADLMKWIDKSQYLVLEFDCLVPNLKFGIGQHYFVLRSFWREDWLPVCH